MQLARDYAIWMFNRTPHGALPEPGVIELYVGDNLLAMPDQQVRSALARFASEMAA